MSGRENLWHVSIVIGALIKMAHVITLTLCISIDETIRDVCIPAEVCWSKAAITLPDETCITLPCSRCSALSSDKVVILVGGKRGDLKSLRKMPLTLYDAMLIRGLSCPVLFSLQGERVVWCCCLLSLSACEHCEIHTL